MSSKLTDLISEFSAEDRFPQPWTKFHAMHSELDALSKWVQHKDGKRRRLSRVTNAIFTTIYTDEEGNQVDVEACPNCTLVLDRLGFQRLHPDGDGDRIVSKGQEERYAAASES